MKIKAVWALLLSLALMLVLTLTTPATTPSSSPLPQMKRLTSQIDYWFVGQLGQTDDEGRRLIWEATITGDFTGTMKWWFGPSPVPGGVDFVGGRVGYYAGRWEIWDGEELLLAGESAGKTVTYEGADGMWDGHGVVTEASGKFNALKGRHIYETGPVVWEPFPYSGTGMFVIY